MSQVKVTVKEGERVSIPGEVFDDLVRVDENYQKNKNLTLIRIAHLKNLVEQEMEIRLSGDHFSRDEKIIGVLKLSHEKMLLLNEEIKFLRKIL